MWIVMNKLDVEKGKADAVKARFETTKGIETMEGFVRLRDGGPARRAASESGS